MSRYKARICLFCSKPYSPTNGTQKYCVPCGPLVIKLQRKTWYKNLKTLNPDKYETIREKGRQKQRKWYLSMNNEDKVAYMEKTKDARRLRRKQEKLSVLDILGNKCAKCNYNDDIRALCIDHINGDGYLEKERHYEFIKEIIKNPTEAKKRYQILCSNCNRIKQDDNKEYPTATRLKEKYNRDSEKWLINYYQGL